MCKKVQAHGEKRTAFMAATRSCAILFVDKKVGTDQNIIGNQVPCSRDTDRYSHGITHVSRRSSFVQRA